VSACTGPGRVLGCDVALRHAGVVLLDEAGAVVTAWALVKGAADAKALAVAGVRVQRVPHAEQEASGPQADLLRLCTLRGWLDAVAGEARAQGATGAVLEGVGFHRGTSQAAVASLYQAHAVARLALADAGIPHDVVEPSTISKALHGGRRLAKGMGKVETARVVRERWGQVWPGDGEGDVADAYVLARVGRGGV